MTKTQMKHVPPPVERSRLLAAEWDIAAMQKYIAERNVPPSEASISFEAMQGFFGDDYDLSKLKNGGEKVSFRIGMFNVERERAMSDEIDPSIPIIIADITGRDGTVIGRAPIDGRHRMYKAWKTATSDPVIIPFHFISAAEELQFRTERSVKPDPVKKPRRKKAS